MPVSASANMICRAMPSPSAGSAIPDIFDRCGEYGASAQLRLPNLKSIMNTLPTFTYLISMSSLNCLISFSVGLLKST